MAEPLAISSDDNEAIIAALRGIGELLKQIEGERNRPACYAIWNNLMAIRLRLSKASEETASRN